MQCFEQCAAAVRYFPTILIVLLAVFNDGAMIALSKVGGHSHSQTHIETILCFRLTSTYFVCSFSSLFLL